MTELLRDFQIGLRMLRKRLGTTALAVAAMALGIGLTTTMFSIVNGAILRGLPFEDSDRILHLARIRPAESDDDFGVSIHDLLDWRDAQTTFEGLAAFSNEGAIVSRSGQAAERLQSAHVSANTFGLLGAVPALGRDFVEADSAAGAAIVVIGDQVWDSQFGRREDAIGQTLRINGVTTTVVGVMPPGFRFPVTHDLWLPLDLTRPTKRGEGPGLEVIGRLSPRIDAAEAQAEFAAIAAQLSQAHPENEGTSALVRPYLHEFLGTEVISTLFAMLGAVFGVLLIACANVTNLQLARAADRSREIAIRTALGAKRWQIIRQLLIEGLVLTSGGALLGVALASVGVGLFNQAIVNTNPPFWVDIRLDTPVMAFVVGITSAAAIISSLWPAIRVTRAATSQVLSDQNRGTTSLRVGVMTRGLVVVSVALSCGLLLVSGLMIKAVTTLVTTEYPYATDDVLVARLSAETPPDAAPGDAARLDLDLEERLATVPGVTAVALSTDLPGEGSGYVLTIDGETYATPEDRPAVRRTAVSPGFFDTLGVAPVAGRVFTAADREGSERVALVDTNFVARYSPDRDPLGRRIRLGRSEDAPWSTIVGVVPALVVVPEPREVIESTYVPLAQSPEWGVVLLARTSQVPTSLTPAIRGAVGSLDPDIAMFRVDSLAGELWQSAWPFRVFGTLFMSFGFAALVMATAGLYGVLTFAVRRRTQELGIRMALGADKSHVVRLVLWQGLRYVGTGLVIGTGFGLLLGPLMQELLRDVGPRDPMVFGTTLSVLLITGLVASLVPAFQAASADPLQALRHD